MACIRACAIKVGLNHSLHRGVKGAKGFYTIYAGLISVSATIVLIPGSPLGLLTEGVQVLAGVLDITPERVEILTGRCWRGWPARCPGAWLAGPVLTGG